MSKATAHYRSAHDRICALASILVGGRRAATVHKWPSEGLLNGDRGKLALRNFAHPASSEIQQQGHEDDDEHEVEDCEHGAIADVRPIAVFAIDEARHRVGCSSGPTGRHVDDNVRKF